MVVGREPTCDVHFDDPHVSRAHAALRRRGNAVYVQDLGSSGGTFVNGVAATAARELHPGDIVAFANVKARFEPGGAVTDDTSAVPAETAGAASSRYHIDQQHGEIISNVGRDQYNSYAQHVIQQRETFLREIAATKTKARWLIWAGFLAFVAGFGLFAAGVLGFLKQAGSAVQSGDAGPPTSPFGPKIAGIPSGLLGWALAALGMLLLVVGIVLHIVATSRRRRVRTPGTSTMTGCWAHREGDMNFNIGGQTAGVINNVAGDQRVSGGQEGTVVPAEDARRAVRELRDGLATAALNETTAAEANAQVAEIEAVVHAPQPDRSRVARSLERLTRLLVAAGSLSTASAALIGPLQTLAAWLGTLGEPILHMLPVLG